jgi:Tfp pilus assembly protein PilP
MRVIGAALLAASALSLSACGAPPDSEAKRLADVAEQQAEATAAAMENRAEVLSDQADAQAAPSDAPFRADVTTLETQAQKTNEVTGELSERIQQGAP